MTPRRDPKYWSRTLLAVALTALTVGAAGCSNDTGSASAPAPTSTATVQPADAGHRMIGRLAGEWNGAKSTFIAGGTADNPLRSHIVSRWSWITKTGNNFLREEAEGTLGGKPYYRLGLLGYSPADDRFEWTTVDSVTPMTMTYKGEKGSGGQPDITALGEFTDPGVLGPQFVGKTIAMRTRISFEGSDHVVMRIYFTPPGGPEALADQVDLTRRS